MLIIYDYVEKANEYVLENVLNNIENEKSIEEKNESEIAEKIRELSEIRKCESEDVKNKTMHLQSLIGESNTILDHFDRSIIDR